MVAYLLCMTRNGLLGLIPLSGETHVDGASECSSELVLSFQESCLAGLTLLASRKGEAMCKSLPAEFGYWRSFARHYFTAVCRQYSQASRRWHSPDPPSDDALDDWLQAAPPMRGLEYATAESLRSLWRGLDAFTERKISAAKLGVADYLKSLDEDWNLVGRVTFHLAENKKNPNFPFAFLATYTEGQSQSGSLQHIPLSEALKESIRLKDTRRLDELLEPVARASKSCKIVERMLETRTLFSPQAWGIRDAYEFLSGISAMESAGVVVRVPNWWNASRPPRPQVNVRIGGRNPGTFSLVESLDFDVNVSIDGDPLTPEEMQQLLEAREGLTLLRGQWIEVDQERLQTAMNHWQTLQKEHIGGLDFLQGMRLLAGATIGEPSLDEEARGWTRIEPGEWLAETLRNLRDPNRISQLEPGDGLNATLRHYQADGVRWLWFASKLGLGVCLADDMGLGKTIQIISLLLQLKRERQTEKKKLPPSLLVVPTSLLGNWQREVGRFAPELKIFIAHRSATEAQTLKRVTDDPLVELEGYDLVVTTYGLARKSSWLTSQRWHMVVLDEAQAIKNPSSAQTKTIKTIPGNSRVILTGTPVENHLGDLWSLFDFCSPGLLGSAREFSQFVSAKDERERARGLAAVRKLIAPYVLRRLKTDPNIAPDLPAKTEMRIDCGLTPMQAGLYKQVLDDLEQTLTVATGIQRRGLVLALLMHLKQICNHPSLYLKQPSFASKDSGKFAELASICETIMEKQEKVLVFSQFQSMCGPLHDYLTTLFGRPGLLLTGKTSAAKRGGLVADFQNELGPPFFVISVKAGGTGLNLTQACHVVHFDRWWNPAVEDQATDRAFRIGQQRNVLVHKFVCRGTLEERIDTLINSKKQLSAELFGKDGELNLTEMTNDQLMEFISLDLNKARMN